MSSSNDEEPQSIAALYAAAESARAALLAHPDPRSSHPAVAATLAAYDACARRLAAAALFSPNESADDLATASLPYLLLDLRRADVLLREPFADPPQRRAVVRRARAAYESFLALADNYGLVGGRWARLLERYRDEPGTFAVATASGAGAGAAAARREAKIAAFRAEKELKQRLEGLRADPRYRGGGEEGGADEDVVRRAHLAAVELGVHEALQGLDSLNREMEMLAMAPERPPPPPNSTSHGADDPNSRRRDADDSTTWRLDKPLAQRGSGPLLSAQGRPLQPFTLVSGGRADLRAGVFRSGHNLPTMSIDEYLEEERRRGNILSGGTDPAPPTVDDDDEEAVDRATYKAREWDDFKDENRRGAGNTMNMG
ncbi:TAP42-like protein [Cordyceps fumosorosea ARSEF 2679]|uniref:TAP42-like protein n=1 Tax=Cordyceps fumosorosea (strain ARSEF 2679) TaxID=1081104 RepID=A0A167UAX3_CORFA|nr:TAP42-like protein [Cordyceps fumosorosea ARSEF 2679]OAA61397.1 TAP42-like protein [Cordyceps fumosorosea ARSEF 2679]